MSINKRALLLPVVTAISLIANILLLSTNCNQSKNSTKRSVANKANRAQKVSPKRSGEVNKPACTNNEDCPADSACQNNRCVIIYEDEYVDAGNLEPEETDGLQGPRSCENANDCGCGYECKYDECHKLASSCNVDGDCNTGDFCDRESDQICGTCVKSECKTDTDCGDTCSNHCEKNRCVQYGCCNDSDCQMDYFCQKFKTTFEGMEGSCKEIECYNDNDCGCGFICDQESKSCLNRSEDRPIPCCSGYFYYKETGSCIPQYLAEDGNCLDSSHCQNGQICNTDYNNCYPASCTENIECGCETVCRKGHCEPGCDTNNDCCDDEYPVCDRGECVSLDVDEE